MFQFYTWESPFSKSLSQVAQKEEGKKRRKKRSRYLPHLKELSIKQGEMAWQRSEALLDSRKAGEIIKGPKEIGWDVIQNKSEQLYREEKMFSYETREK